MKTMLLKVAALAVFLSLSQAVYADAELTEQSVKDESAEVLRTINKKYPGITVTSISKASVGNMYEVIMGKNIAYVDTAADQFLFGHIFDMKTQQDVSQAKLDELSKVEWEKLPLKNAIKVVRGKGTRVFAVFSDPDCPYCKQLEKNLNELDDYTMYVFLNPLEEIHPQARSHSNSIWCSKNPAVVWHEFMANGTSLPTVKTGCAAPVSENIALGQSIGVQGTPILFRKDGKSLPGAAPSASIENFIGGETKDGKPKTIEVNKTK